MLAKNGTKQHNHQHVPNRFAAIPTALRLQADAEHTGRGVTIAIIDSGFYPPPDLIEPTNRIVAAADVTQRNERFELNGKPYDWDWHGTQTSVVAAGNGRLSDGVYKSLASEAQIVLVKASDRGKITEENIARGLNGLSRTRKVQHSRGEYFARRDDDVPYETNIVDQAAEAAVKQGLVVLAAAGIPAVPAAPAGAARQLAIGHHGGRI
jgi:serine protease AprX